MANQRPGPRKGGSPSRRPGKPGQGPRPGHGPGPRAGAPKGGPRPKRRANEGDAPRAAGPQALRPNRRPSGSREQDGPDRLQKVLAHAGIGSRRACEELILQGRITVDNQVVRELGTKVDPRSQQIAVDGQKIREEKPVYYAIHKPKGYVSTNKDPAGKPKVVDLLPEIPQRVYSVGRLDEQSTGLMLLTNDGELANKLAHPKFGVEKVYRVVVAGEPAREVLDQLTQGVWLAEGKVRAKRVRMTGHKGQASIMEMVLAEGKNREIRRMMARMGHKVMSLTRIAIGPIGLKGLPVGGYRPLSAAEVDLLQKVAAGILVPTPRFADRRDRVPRAPTSRPKGAARPVGEDRDQGPHSGRPPHAPYRPASGGQPTGQVYRPKGAARPAGGYRPDASEAGPGRPPGPGQGQGQGPRGNRPPGPGRPPGPQGNRPPGPRGARPAGQGRPSGPPPAGGPTQQGPLGIPPSRRPKSRPPVDEPPRRRIIGMDQEPKGQGSRGDGPGHGPGGGPRPRRAVPKRAPRAAMGIKRRPPAPRRKPGDAE